MRTFCFILIWFGLSGLSVESAVAQSGHTLTVEQSIKMGLEHSYRLRAAQADAEGAQASFRQTRSGRFPSVTGQASYMRLSDNIPEVDFNLPGSDTTYTLLPVELDQFHTELSVEQLLFAGGRLNNRIAAANHQADAAGLMEKQEQADIAYEIREAYWNLYRAQATQQVLESALKRVDRHLKNVRNKVEAGAALRTDLLNARTRRSEVLLDQVESCSQVRVARLELNRLLGLPADAMTEPAPPREPGTMPNGKYAREDLSDQVLRQRPDLQALSEQVKARKAEINAVQGEWFPEISLVGSYIHARPNQYFYAQQDQFKGTWQAGVRLRWVLWSGGQRFAKTSQARARLRKTEARLAEQKEQATVEVARQYLELERAAEAIDVATNGVAAAKEAYESTQRQFDEGAVLSEQVLDAEHAYREALARHAQAIADYKIAHAAVLNALGQIWEK